MIDLLLGRDAREIPPGRGGGLGLPEDGGPAPGQRPEGASLGRQGRARAAGRVGAAGVDGEEGGVWWTLNGSILQPPSFSRDPYIIAL